MIYYEEGDLLNVEAKKVSHILHQTNCVTKKAKGLALQLFTRFPEANIYKDRKHNHEPGTLKITTTTLGPTIIHLMGQRQPGAPVNEITRHRRFSWFRESLAALSVKIYKNPTEYRGLAFPYKIGCGLAGGSWRHYEQAIKDFAVRHPNLAVYIIKRPQDS